MKHFILLTGRHEGAHIVEFLFAADGGFVEQRAVVVFPDGSIKTLPLNALTVDVEQLVGVA